MSNLTVGFIYCTKKLEKKKSLCAGNTVNVSRWFCSITISFIKISCLLDLSLAHLAKGKVNFCPDLPFVVC